MDAAIAHALSDKTLQNQKTKYKHFAIEYNALLDILTNLAPHYTEEDLKLLTDELDARTVEANRMHREIFVQSQITSYLAGRILGQADTKNAQ